MADSPEIPKVEGADAFVRAEGSTTRVEKAGTSGPSGVEEHGTSARGSPRNLGELGVSSEVVRETGRSERYRGTKENEVKREGRREVGTPHSTEESGELFPAGPGGGKGESEQGAVGGKRRDIPRSVDTYTKLRRVAELARKMPGKALTSLSHHMDVEFLREAYRRTRRDGATGADGQTWDEYGEHLEENLRGLLDRAKSGTYRAPPVRRVRIPKGDGKETRPIGIPTIEDKVLQRGVAMLLEAVYEEDFKDFSYGFRPHRSAHGALEAVWKNVMDMGGCWLVEVDLRRFFDTLGHGQLLEIMSQRVRDGVLLRLIGKWLNAGVLEGEELSYPEAGTPQGGVISPLLANVYLHHVLDEWWAKDVQPRLRGRAFLVRYADDFVMGFEDEQDAKRVAEALPERFGQFGLGLNAEKTRRVDFRRPHERTGRHADGTRPGTFDFLGFTHYWGRSRKGHPTVKQKTAASRFRRTLKRAGEWLRTHFHAPVRWQHERLSVALRGHDSYFGVTGNVRALQSLRHRLTGLWRRWLARRSTRGVPWEQMNLLLARFPLPPARVVHSCYGVSKALL